MSDDRTTPAERYAAFRRRQAESTPALLEFRAFYDFDFDPFQLDACHALAKGASVLVAAPTGSGKTVVGEFAVYLALRHGQKCFYTTPIKALSNQKYADLLRRHGADAVGLLTGDNTINGQAPIVVMTTEVLRNMLYEGSPTLAGLGYVVLDEVHYLADRFRGAVWEEVIIHLPEAVRVIALSATVSNAEEFGEWLQEVRGDTTVIVDEHRPVPLWQHMLVGSRLFDLFVAEGESPTVNPALLRLARDDAPRSRPRPAPRRGAPPPRRLRVPSRVEVVERLDAAGLLPAIIFIFSRAGCDAAVLQCLRARLRLTTSEEVAKIRAHAERRCADIPDADRVVLGYDQWLAGLCRGVAAHHAGLLPTFKEVVEELFSHGLIKAVFATETLALGINMPARSVVVERLDKWNGEAHVDLTPGEYTQLTGRAGRRGIDVEGHAVVVWQPGLDPAWVAGLAGTRTYPLNSSFRPSYNMAINLVGQVGRERARALLEASFAQFQADRAVVGLARRLRRAEEALLGYERAATCHLGDFMQYARLRRALAQREAALARRRGAARRASAAQALMRLRRGDVIYVPVGRHAGFAVVLDPGLDRAEPAPLVLTAERKVKRLSVADFPDPVAARERIPIPRAFDVRSPRSRRDLAATLRNKLAGTPSTPRDTGEDAEISRLRHEIRAHPCHGCPERDVHARWADRHFRLQREVATLRRRVAGRSHVIARTFDRVCAVLEQLGYLAGEQVSAEGRLLGRLYTELDLLTAECLREGLWEALTPPELAACVSTLVYEERRGDAARHVTLPAGVRAAVAAMQRRAAELAALEDDHELAFQHPLDLGFAWAAYRWADAGRLEDVLTESGLSAGDFVRWSKQVLDLLGQLADSAPATSRVPQTARVAMQAMRRGIVAYSSLA